MFNIVPEPTKDGEGKEDEQKAAEALGLDASGGLPHWSLSKWRVRHGTMYKTLVSKVIIV